MTAALTRTEPTRVWERSTVFEAEEITANVVPVAVNSLGFGGLWGQRLPKDVADRAAPIMKVSTGPGHVCKSGGVGNMANKAYHSRSPNTATGRRDRWDKECR
jgi:hypothetical protein